MSECFHDVRITLETHRCPDCGRWWGVERGYSGRCPRCADSAIHQANENTQKAQRSAASLRGALTRANRKKARRG